MRSSASKFNNTKARLMYGLAGLTLWAWFAELVEKALVPYRSVFCVAGKELLLAIPFGRLCEVALATGVKGGAVLASTPWFTWMASMIHVIRFTWRV